MKTLLVLFMLLLPVSAWAISDPLVDYCLTTKDPTRCLQEVTKWKQEYADSYQRDLAAQRQHEMNVARQQATGFALFGSGPALINGMNQGFQNMQVHPYYLPPPAPSSQMRNCTSQQVGHQIYTNCY